MKFPVHPKRIDHKAKHVDHLLQAMLAIDCLTLRLRNKNDRIIASVLPLAKDNHENDLDKQDQAMLQPIFIASVCCVRFIHYQNNIFTIIFTRQIFKIFKIDIVATNKLWPASFIFG